MEHHEPMSTTGARWARQCAARAMGCTHRGLPLLGDSAGGPLDAPQYLAAGSCNSVEWGTVRGPLAHQTEIERGAA